MTVTPPEQVIEKTACYLFCFFLTDGIGILLSKYFLSHLQEERLDCATMCPVFVYVFWKCPKWYPALNFPRIFVKDYRWLFCWTQTFLEIIQALFFLLEKTINRKKHCCFSEHLPFYFFQNLIKII